MEHIRLADLCQIARSHAPGATALWTQGHPIRFGPEDCAQALTALRDADLGDDCRALIAAVAQQIRPAQPGVVPDALLAAVIGHAAQSRPGRSRRRPLDEIGAAVAIAGLLRATHAQPAAGTIMRRRDRRVTITFYEIRASEQISDVW